MSIGKGEIFCKDAKKHACTSAEKEHNFYESVQSSAKADPIQARMIPDAKSAVEDKLTDLPAWQESSQK